MVESINSMLINNEIQPTLENLKDLTVLNFVKAINKIRFLFSRKPILYSLFQRMDVDGDLYHNGWVEEYKSEFLPQLKLLDTEVDWEKHLFDLVVISMKIGNRMIS